MHCRERCQSGEEGAAEVGTISQKEVGMARRKLAWSAALACVGMLLQGPLAAGSQDPAQQQPAGKQRSEMAARCKEMMDAREKMMTEMKAADERLDGLVTKMNAASGEQKTDAIAATVTELVAQRRTMRERMAGMQQRMMAHMGEHMQAGPQSMAACPMMKMGGMKY